MKKAIFCLAIFSVLFSCGKKEEQAAFNEQLITEQIENDPITKELSLVNEKKATMSIDGEFNLGKMNSKMIRENVSKCKTLEDRIALYEKAGMKNAKKYFEITAQQIILMGKIQRSHPELKNLDAEKQKAIVSSITTNGAKKKLKEYNKNLKSTIIR